MLELAVLGAVIVFFGTVIALLVNAAKYSGQQEGENRVKDAISRKDNALNEKISNIQSRTPDWRAAINELRQRSRDRRN